MYPIKKPAFTGSTISGPRGGREPSRSWRKEQTFSLTIREKYCIQYAGIPSEAIHSPADREGIRWTPNICLPLPNPHRRLLPIRGAESSFFLSFASPGGAFRAPVWGETGGRVSFVSRSVPPIQGSGLSRRTADGEAVFRGRNRRGHREGRKGGMVPLDRHLLRQTIWGTTLASPRP